MIILTASSAVAAAFVFGVIGPVSLSYRDSALERVAIALLYTAIGAPVFYGLIASVFYLMRRRRPVEILAVLICSIFFAAFQNSATVHTMEGFLHSGYPAQSGFLSVFLVDATVTLTCTLLYFYVVWQRLKHGTPDASTGDGATGQRAPDSNSNVRGAGMGRESDGRLEPAAETPLVTSAATTEEQLPAGHTPALFELIPDGLGTDLVFIKSEDHYLEVHTTAGSGLIKMRFSDAIAELGDRGIRVHRSYWAATGHITRSVRTGKRTVLRLTGDHRVPVSVTHLRSVRSILSEAVT
jgi:hypothetical protein